MPRLPSLSAVMPLHQQQQHQQLQHQQQHQLQQQQLLQHKVRSLSSSARPDYHPYQPDPQFDAHRRRTHSMSTYPLLKDSQEPDRDTATTAPHSITTPTTTEPKRLNYSPEIRAILLSWLGLNREYPYPTDQDKNDLAQKTGLTLQQVNNWFINARRRKYQYMLEDVGSPGSAAGGGVDSNSPPVQQAVLQQQQGGTVSGGANTPPWRATFSAGSSASPIHEVDRRMALAGVGPGRRRAFSGNAASAIVSTPPSHSPYWKTAAESFNQQQQQRRPSSGSSGSRPQSLYSSVSSGVSDFGGEGGGSVGAGMGSLVRGGGGGGGAVVVVGSSGYQPQRLTQNSPLQHVYQLEKPAGVAAAAAAPIVLTKGPPLSAASFGFSQGSSDDRKVYQPQHLSNRAQQPYHLTPYNLSQQQQYPLAPTTLLSSSVSSPSPYRTAVPPLVASKFPQPQTIPSSSSITSSVTTSTSNSPANIPSTSTTITESPTTTTPYIPLGGGAAPQMMASPTSIPGLMSLQHPQQQQQQQQPSPLRTASFPNNQYIQQQHGSSGGVYVGTQPQGYNHEAVCRTQQPSQTSTHVPPLRSAGSSIEYSPVSISESNGTGARQPSYGSSGVRLATMFEKLSTNRRGGSGEGLEVLVEAAMTGEGKEEGEGMEGVVMEGGGEGEAEYAAKQVSMRWKERDAIWGI
ncbi:Iroquois homeobox 3 [Podochytrium sp. JEL0797]|nr:Iroquois homeobox 3 [Podochytrium sp. JEL0797]